jgi:hypothetical protein
VGDFINLLIHQFNSVLFCNIASKLVTTFTAKGVGAEGEKWYQMVFETSNWWANRKKHYSCAFLNTFGC